MNKFEQLIEYVINDEDAKARELFHEIVVEKSRAIYEDIMTQEAKEEEELDEDKDEEVEEELDEASLGGDAADDLIDDVEMDEESELNMEQQEEEEEEGEEEGEEEFEIDAESGSSEPATKDDIMNLEDKLDELMAEFESLMGDEGATDGDDFEADAGADAIEMDDTEEMMPEMGMMPMEESVSLKAAPKPVTSEQGDINKKSTVAANSGSKGAMAKPVHPTGTEAQGRPAPTTKDLITDFQNKAGASMKDQKAAPKPVTAQASGVNTHTPFPKG